MTKLPVITDDDDASQRILAFIAFHFFSAVLRPVSAWGMAPSCCSRGVVLGLLRLDAACMDAWELFGTEGLGVSTGTSLD